MSSRTLQLAVRLLPLGLVACAAVLGIRAPRGAHPFEHRPHVLQGTSCLECHAGMVSSGDLGALHLPGGEACRRCHEKPHDERTCSGCHGEEHTRQRAELAKRHLRFEHKSHVGPASGQCVRCHAAVGESRPESLLPPMATCFSCHAHQDEFSARRCESCHVDLPAERVLPESHVVHDGDFVREHGVRAASARDLCATCHSERFCSSCHGQTVPALPARLAFDSPRLQGLHRAGFRSRHAEEARAQPGLCITCHSEESCRECHGRTGVGVGGTRGTPHPAGWLSLAGGGEHGRAASMDPVSCASCHGGAGEQLCVECHRVGGPGGNPHGPGFSSAKDMRRDAPCRMCHAP